MNVGVGVFVEVGVAVAVPAVAVAVAVLVAVPVALPTMIRTNTSLPKKVPLAVDIRQFPCTGPVLMGAVMGMESSTSAPGLTGFPKTRVVPPMASPLVKTNLKPASQVQLPVFLTRHVFIKDWPGSMAVLSWMVTSAVRTSP